jgi:hypothetical protein
MQTTPSTTQFTNAEAETETAEEFQVYFCKI